MRSNVEKVRNQNKILKIVICHLWYLDFSVGLAKEMATHSSVLAWRIQGWRSLVGCSPWGHTESDTTEAT